MTACLGENALGIDLAPAGGWRWPRSRRQRAAAAASAVARSVTDRMLARAASIRSFVSLLQCVNMSFEVVGTGRADASSSASWARSWSFSAAIVFNSADSWPTSCCT